VQAARVHEREGTPLLDEDDDPVGKTPDELRPPDLRDGRDPGRDGGGIQPPEIGSGRDRGGVPHSISADPGGAFDLDPRHRELGRRQEPADPEGRPRQDKGPGQNEPGDARHPRGAAATLTAAGASHPLAGDERRSFAEVGQAAPRPAGRDEAGVRNAHAHSPTILISG
jgi:hypothetical protein